jgi:hypothetical protein
VLATLFARRPQQDTPTPETPATDTDAAETNQNKQPDRPENLQIRFQTVGGSYVDVTGTEYLQDNRWKCHGCKATSDFPQRDWLSFMRSKANKHANECRAIHL